MPIEILRDPIYPLIPKLYIKILNSSKKHSNNRCRIITERAFGRLKGCWYCLFGRLDLNEENIPMIIAI